MSREIILHSKVVVAYPPALFVSSRTRAREGSKYFIFLAFYLRAAILGLVGFSNISDKMSLFVSYADK
tara:strand:+ start:641 stop:844 length:204 start_codon:yes stop_codon:yes gene_type:complete